MVHKKKASAKTAKAVSAKSASVKKDARKVLSHRQAAKPAAKSPSKSVAAKAVKPTTKPAKSAEVRPAAAPKAKVQAAPAASVTKVPPKAAAAPVAPKAPVAVAKAVAAAARPAVAPRAIPAAVDKPDASRLTAPAMPKHLAEKAAAARQQQINAAATAAAAAAASKKPLTQRNGFKTSEFIVYPAHGVGRIIGIEEQEIAGISLELFVIQFEKDKMTLRVPTGKSQSVGMRKLSDDGVVKRAMETLKGKARIKRTMWSRRAQEYEAKINSGDLIAIAEVVRDLYRSETQPEQSYSERQLYEAALDRMAREIAAVEKLDERGAMQRITEVLSKSAKGRRMAEETNGAEIKAA
jgi:CarD family transcriptional regulator